MKLKRFANEKYIVLEYLNDYEINVKNDIYSKISQDKIATDLKMSKHTVNAIINDLLNSGEICRYSAKGKYKVTSLGKKIIEVMNQKLENEKKYNCISLFAGVGGIDLGFEQAGFKTIYANEIDPKAVETYENNFNLKVDNRDIHDVVNDLDNGINPFPDTFDILTAGFPCQAFSIAGYREGFDDKKGRGGLFFEIMKIIRHTHPKVVFLENVKNLQSHDNGKTYTIIKEALKSEGYYIKAQLLNSMEYGNVPQNRERIYIVAFLDENMKNKFELLKPIKLSKQLDDIIDYASKVDDKYYYTKDSFKRFDELYPFVKSKDTLYQWRRIYVRENKSGVCPTLTANMGTGGHNVPLVLTDNGIRKLTPRECFSFQGFPKNFVLPETLSNSYLYKQAGNSVSVTVIKRIAEKIKEVL